MRILLADSDIACLEAVQSFLWDHGHEAEIAGDALECITTIREFAPDLLVVDRDLPWGGGLGVLQWVAGQPMANRLSMILTSDGELEDDLVALTGLPVGCFRKPYRLGELLSHIESAPPVADSHLNMVEVQ